MAQAERSHDGLKLTSRPTHEITRSVVRDVHLNGVHAWATLSVYEDQTFLEIEGSALESPGITNRGAGVVIGVGDRNLVRELGHALVALADTVEGEGLLSHIPSLTEM